MAVKKAEVITLLRKYLRDAEQVCHVDKAILFGSHAHGRAKKYSDIDVAIFSRNVTDKNRLATMSKLIVLVGKLKVDIQPVVFPFKDFLHSDSDFINKEIKKKGIEITSAVSVTRSDLFSLHATNNKIDRAHYPKAKKTRA